MNKKIPWSTAKICFDDITSSKVDKLLELNKKGTIKTPGGWKRSESGSIGASGYYVVFDVSVFPTIEDGLLIRKMISGLK